MIYDPIDINSVTMKSIPNIFTFLNILLGTSGIFIFVTTKNGYVDYDNTGAIPLIIFAAAICDFLDGFFAKLLKAHSTIGKELDSFADFLTFGLLPSIMIYHMINDCYPQSSWTTIPPLLMPCFTAYRLARFNIIANDTTEFVGLSSTAVGIFVAFLFNLKLHAHDSWVDATLLSSDKALSLLCAILCILMVSKIQFLSLKQNSWAWQENKIRYTIITLSILLSIIFKTKGAICAFILYILVSFISHFFASTKS